MQVVSITAGGRKERCGQEEGGGGMREKERLGKKVVSA